MSVPVRDLPDRYAVSVLTGFLGSGKTTVLNGLLSHPDMDETAVLINEFGEIGLDHLLTEHVSEDVVLLNSGCLCCSIRGDLISGMKDLFLKRVRGEIPAFNRLVIETTGLADPAPILHTLMTDPLIANKYRLDGVVTTVDAVHGQAQFDRHMEAVKQAAVADRALITKADLVKTGTIDALSARLKDLNPGAQPIIVEKGRVSPASLFNAGLYNPETKTPDVQRWLKAEAFAASDGHGHGHDHEHPHHHHHDVNRHDNHIKAFCLTIETPVHWDAFVTWAEIFTQMRGDRLLRIKGILNVAGEDTPVVVHGVQHVFHPPVTLPAWPTDDRRTRLVFITRDLGRDVIEQSLAALNKATDEALTD